MITRRILFVHGDAAILHDLELKMRGRVLDWEMVFTKSAKEAVQLLRDRPFDVIVADPSLPGADGRPLLAQVIEEYPATVRIALTETVDPDLALKSAQLAHQYLEEKVETATLVRTIKRLCDLRDHLNSLPLMQVVTKIDRLPSLPSLYMEVMAELRSRASSLARVGKIISKDIGMTTKMLQLVNSAFFGLRQKVTDPGHAVAMLGINTVTSLILSVDILSQFDRAKAKFFNIEDLFSHSTLTAVCAREIAQIEGAPKDTIENAFLAGFLHDVGKLLLAHNLPKEYRRVIEASKEEGLMLTEAELEVLGATHADVGGYLLGIWGLPDPVVEAVLYHHTPNHALSRDLGPLAAVHVANAMTEIAAWPDADPDVDTEYLFRLGMLERLDEWRSSCRAVIEAGSDSESPQSSTERHLAAKE